MSTGSQQKKRENGDKIARSPFPKRRRGEASEPAAPKQDKSLVEGKAVLRAQEFIMQKSKAFEAMFSGSFKGGQESKANFPEENPAAFALLIQWLYTGQVSSVDLTVYNKAIVSTYHNRQKPRKTAEEQVKTAAEDVCAALRIRARLFMLAEMYQIIDVLDTTMISIWAGYRHISRLPTIEEICFVYEGTTEGSLLRKYMAHCCYWQATSGSPEDFNSFVDNAIVHRDLVRDFMYLTRFHNSAKTSPSKMPYCVYYQSSAKLSSTTNTNDCPFKASDKMMFLSESWISDDMFLTE